MDPSLSIFIANQKAHYSLIQYIQNDTPYEYLEQFLWFCANLISDNFEIMRYFCYDENLELFLEPFPEENSYHL